MEQVEFHIETGLEDKLGVDHASFYMKVGSINSKMEA